MTTHVQQGLYNPTVTKHLISPGSDVEGDSVTVGTSAVELTFAGTPQSILITSDPDNTGKIWVGKSNVDSSGNNAFTVIAAGGAISVDLDDTTNAIYVVSDTASQTVYKMALI